MSKAILLFILMFSSVLHAASTDVDLSLFLNQEDKRFEQVKLIEPDQPSSLCGPTTLANFIQLLSYEKNGPVIPAQTFINEMAKSQQDVLSSGIDVRDGLTTYDFVKFASVFLKKFDLKVKWKTDSSSSKEGINLETLFSSEPSVLMLRFTDRRTNPPMGRPGRRSDPRMDPPLDPGGFNMDEDYLTGFHYVLKVSADKEQSLLWLIDPADPGHWTIVKVQKALDSYSNQETVFVIPQGPTDFQKGAPVGRFFRWSISENLVPSL